MTLTQTICWAVLLAAFVGVAVTGAAWAVLPAIVVIAALDIDSRRR